jgi:hypothetical protein
MARGRYVPAPLHMQEYCLNGKTLSMQIHTPFGQGCKVCVEKECAHCRYKSNITSACIHAAVDQDV